jgi:PST family polysaccharide transporter
MSSVAERVPHSTAKQAVRGTFWSFLSFFAGRVLTFVTTVILATLLTPSEFGIVGYCTIAIAYLELLNNFGVGHALIARRDRFEEAANAAFWIGLGSSILLFAAGWLAAPFVAQFFRTPEIVPMFRVLSLILLFGGIGTVPTAMIHRDLRFKAYLVPSIGRNIVKGAVGIGLAWAGYGPWALIWSEVVSRAIEATVPWLLVRWRPTAAFDAAITRSMLIFGGHMIAITLIGAFMTNVDYLLVGRILGSAALGYYLLAFRLPELVIRNTNDIVARVAFPVMAQMQSDQEYLSRTYFGYLRYISLFSFPAGVGLALITAPFIRTFYPPVWQPSVLPMQLISLQMAIAAISYVPGIIYKAINRPEILTRLSLVKLPVVVAVLWYGTHWGIDGVATGMLALALASSVLDCAVVQRILGFAWGDLYRALAPAAICATSMGLIVLGFNRLVPMSGVLEIVLNTLLGAAVYLCGLLLLSRETVMQAQTALRAAISRS